MDSNSRTTASLSSEQFEILAPREIRKAGIDLLECRVLRRISLVDEQGSAAGFALELSANLAAAGEIRPLLIACRSEPDVVSCETVEAAHTAAVRAGVRHLVIFSATGFEPTAAERARALGIALLAVADGRAAFARGPWGSGGPAPSWVPEFVAETVDVDRAGIVLRQPIVAGRPDAILDRMRDLAADAAPLS